MTVVKIGGALAAAAADSLGRCADWLYANPNGRIVGVVELGHLERVEPAPGTERKKIVTLRMETLEVAAPGDQEDVLRRAAQAMYLIRTASGTLDPEGEVEMGETTLQQTVVDVNAREAARLSIATRELAARARSALRTSNPSVTELRHELQAIADGLFKVLNPYTEV